MDKIKKYNVVRFRDEAEQIRFPVAVLALNHPTYVDRLSRAPRIVAWSTLENALGDDNTYRLQQLVPHMDLDPEIRTVRERLDLLRVAPSSRRSRSAPVSSNRYLEVQRVDGTGIPPVALSPHT
jgi:hypothetical protein